MNAIGMTSCGLLVVAIALSGLAVRWRACRRSRWRRLGCRYPAPARKMGRAFSSATVRVNGHLYRDRVTVRLSGAGLGLSLPRPFRTFHPPMFVPWDDLTPVELTVANELPIRIGEHAEIALRGEPAGAAMQLFARALNDKSIQ